MQTQADNQYARPAQRSPLTLRCRRRGWLLRGLLLTAGSLLSACGWLSSGQGGVRDAPAAAAEEWFCDSEPTGAGWLCTQGAGSEPLRAPERTLQRHPRLELVGSVVADPGVGAEREPATEAEASTVPEYLRLAFRPREPVSLQELPRGYFAVQLLSMSSRDGLEGLVGEKGISGLSAARVEKDGRLFYALLLGIYENQSLARRAAADAPTQFRHVTPWVRPVGSLQAAIARADALVEAGVPGAGAVAPPQQVAPARQVVPPQQVAPARQVAPAPHNAGDDVPEYVRLAVAPRQGASLLELPRSYYAVQLLSMSSRKGLEGLVGEQGIRGLSAARVEKGGQLYYALLLGIYENEALARRAAEHAPPQFRHGPPWVRPIGSLQSAVARADALANASRP